MTPPRRPPGRSRPAPAPANPATDFVLRGEHITLDALLKATGLADSGGAAKMQIAGGAVRVNGEAESRRGRKLRAGDRVTLAGLTVHILAGPIDPVAPPETPQRPGPR